MFTLLSLAAVCVSIGHKKEKPVMTTTMKGLQTGVEEQEERHKWGYLSFCKKDIGDDVRETAAQH